MLALLLVLATLPSQAEQDTLADLRCFAALAMVTDSATADTNVEFAGAAMFYYGRIDARTPGFDLEAGLRPLMTQAAVDRTLKADLRRCADELAGRLGLLGRAGKSLQALAAALPAK
jgi:hypothetical protein